MKAVHWSWAMLVPLVGVLIEQVGVVMQGHPPNWLVIGPAISGIVAVFLPAAQLGLPGVVQPANKLDMPVTIAEIKAGDVPNPAIARHDFEDTNAGNTGRHT